MEVIKRIGLFSYFDGDQPRLLFSLDLDKCVSFEKSVSFCDDPVDLHEGKHSPQPTGIAVLFIIWFVCPCLRDRIRSRAK